MTLPSEHLLFITTPPGELQVDNLQIRLMVDTAHMINDRYIETSKPPS
jgi:hypothetical protein